MEDGARVVCGAGGLRQHDRSQCSVPVDGSPARGASSSPPPTAPAQKYETVFPKFFVEAFSQAETDLDKDARISIWEAFARASAGVRQYYRQRGQLAVEKPVLDDTGDGVGKDATTTGADGSLASRVFLDAEDDPARAAGPALSELINRRNVLESEFDELKRRRSFITAADYDKRRDDLLIEIARVSRRIRAEQSKRS